MLTLFIVLQRINEELKHLKLIAKTQPTSAQNLQFTEQTI